MNYGCSGKALRRWGSRRRNGVVRDQGRMMSEITNKTWIRISNMTFQFL